HQAVTVAVGRPPDSPRGASGMEIATSQKITTFLMFEGNAEEAMTFYLSLFADAAVISVSRYGTEGPGAEGSVQQAAVVPRWPPPGLRGRPRRTPGDVPLR